MNIALVKCPREAVGLFTENSESLALGYLTASLRAVGHRVALFNGALRDVPIQEMVCRLLAEDYPLIGINVPDPTLVRPTFELVQALRAGGYAGHICVGGHTATFHSEEVLTRCEGIDSVALHEGEGTACDLAAALEARRDCRAVRGLAIRAGGAVVRSAPRAAASDLDQLSFPSRDDLPWVLQNLPDAGAVPVLASRGCYFNCSFCSVRAFYERDGRPTWRRRSVGNVLHEVAELIQGYGVTDILFVDDLFVSRSRPTLDYAEAFAKAVIQSGHRFTFTISATVDSVNRETFALLREAGLRQVFVGAESASTEVLKALNKWFRPEQIETAVRILDDLGIDSSVSYINFTPATRLPHLRANIDFFSSLGSSVLQGLLNRYQVYGGTPLYFELLQAGLLTGEFPEFGYRGTDPGVELVYEVCRQSLGSFIELQFEMKRVERLACAREVALGNGNDIVTAHEMRTLLREITRGVNEDVATVFRTILDFVEAQGARAAENDLGSFREEVRQGARCVTKEWLGTLALFSRSFSGAVGSGLSPDTGGLGQAGDIA